MTSQLTRTGADLLYLVVDLGDEPVSPGRLSQQFQILGIFSEYCTDVAVVAHLFRAAATSRHRENRSVLEESAVEYALRGPGKTTVPRPSPAFSAPTVISSINVLRTSFASPWVTVLGSLANASQPVAYGVSGLFGLHRLMAMVMDWQRHRREIEQLDWLQNQRAKVIGVITDHALAEITMSAGDEPLEESMNRRREAVSRIADLYASDIGRAILSIKPIRAADIIDDDDPRASGARNSVQ